MGLSTNTTLYTGGIKTFPVAFALGFANRTDVVVYIEGRLDSSGDQQFLNFTWNSDSEILVTDALVVNVDRVVVERNVSKTELIVDFTQTGTATRFNLARALKHSFHAMQEFIDGRINALPATHPLVRLAASTSAGALNARLDADRAGTSASRAQLFANEASDYADATAADRVATRLDAAATAADVVIANTQAAAITTAATSGHAAATAADRVATGLDAAATAADRVEVKRLEVQSQAYSIATAEDSVATAQDRVATTAAAGISDDNRVATGNDRASSSASSVAADASRVTAATAADNASNDRTATAADRALAETAATQAASSSGLAGNSALAARTASASAAADVAATSANRVATAADAAATAADRVATAADAVTTAQDAADTAADVAASAAAAAAILSSTTGGDAAKTAADAVATAADRVATGEDAIATAADVVATAAVIATVQTLKAGTQTDRVATAADRALAETAATQADANRRVASNAASTASTASAAAAADVAATSANRVATTADAAASVVARSAIESALDQFTDLYLGAKTTDPTVDNDGDALVAGALYFNRTSSVMLVYSGTAWVAAYASLEGGLSSSNNLSDLTDTAAARLNLGLAIGANVQAYTDVLSGTSASFTSGLKAKLDTIAEGATVGTTPTAAEIKTAYEGQTKAFTDTLFDKLAAIAEGATVNQTAEEIKTAYEGEDNAFTDVLFAKLTDIAEGATADQTGADIKTAYEAEDNAFTDDLFDKLSGIAPNATAGGGGTEDALPLAGGTVTGRLVLDQNATNPLRIERNGRFFDLGLDASGNFGLLSLAGGNARLYPAGDTLDHVNALVTREKGDARFLQLKAPHNVITGELAMRGDVLTKLSYNGRTSDNMSQMRFNNNNGTSQSKIRSENHDDFNMSFRDSTNATTATLGKAATTALARPDTIVTRDKGDARYSRKTGRPQILAWVNFKGTGTVSIRDSFGVGSVTDVSSGHYAVNFSPALPNTLYSVNVRTEGIEDRDYSLRGGVRAPIGTRDVGQLEAALHGASLAPTQITKTTSQIGIRLVSLASDFTSASRDADVITVTIIGNT